MRPTAKPVQIGRQPGVAVHTKDGRVPRKHNRPGWNNGRIPKKGKELVVLVTIFDVFCTYIYDL